MRLFRKLFISCLAVLFLFAGVPLAYAQQKVTVKGKVVDTGGLPVPGAAVIEKGTSNGVSTGSEGEFDIEVRTGATLVVSCIGYSDKEAPARNGITITLSEDNLFLDEVVVLAYGTQKKQFVVGSVTQVTSKDIVKAPTTDVTNMLAGKLAGVTAIQSSGTPGEDQAGLTVRGLSTYGSNSGPLYIIDGMESGQISNLNPNDIASISVLKDAATAAIYGVKGGNGVILITTKSGSKADHATINYDGSYTLTRNTAMPEMLNAREYIYWHNMARMLDGNAPMWTEENIKTMQANGVTGDDAWLDAGGTDWRALVYNDFGSLQQHNISASGGNDKFSYYSSMGYMDQKGIVRETGLTRYNVRANIDAKLAQGLRYNINMTGRYSYRHMPGYSFDSSLRFIQGYYNPIQRAHYSIPIIKNTFTDSEGVTYPLGLLNGQMVLSPDSSLTESGYSDSRTYETAIRSTLEYSFDNIDFLKGLKASVFGGFNFSMSNAKSYERSYDLYYFDRTKLQAFKTVSQGIPQSIFSKSYSHDWSYTLRPQISYERTFGKHAISAVALYEQTVRYSESMWGNKSGYVAEEPMDLNNGTTVMSPVNGTHYNTADIGFAERLSYIYDEKYLLELTARQDASYIFAPENRWGIFPSAAIGWTISKEDFFSENVNFVDFMKLRASIGQLGSNDCSPYLWQNRYRSNAPGYFYGFNNKPVAAFYTDGYVYDNLTWSHMTCYNAGFEANLFKNKLSIEFDWFYKYTDRILENAGGNVYAPSLGKNHPSYINTGTMDDRGLELVVTHNNWLSNGFSYSLRGMFSWSRNKVLSRLVADSQPYYGNIVIGQPLGQLYGYHYIGLFETEEQIAAAPAPPSGYYMIGDCMYEDINGDGQFDRVQDYVKVGRSTLPEINYSFNVEMSWKGLSLTALFYGVALCDYPLNGYYQSTGHVDGTIYTRPFYESGNTFKYLVERMYRPVEEYEGQYGPNYTPNTNTKYPRLHGTYNSNNDYLSEILVVSGAYFRLKNLQLSYALPDKLVRYAGLSKASVYIAGTNLFTITEFPYMDPENPGINNGYYPQQKTYSLGVNLTF